MVAQLVEVYDTTLRDGAQGEGLSFSVEDKLKIARKLDELGVHYIEGGWPGSNPKDEAFFRQAHELNLKNARLAAFGSTRRVGVPASQDAQIVTLVAANTPVIAIFGKTSLFHVANVLRTTPEENLEMIADSISYCHAQGRQVIYDAEHFFDGYREDREYAFKTLEAAADAGASHLVLCDTNGGSLPEFVRKATLDVIEHVAGPRGIPVGVHAHDDADLGTANTLAAVQAGATHVQGTINGYGERCGNANLCSVIPNLMLKLNMPCLTPEQLTHLREISLYVSEVANLSHDHRLPYVGASAFAHKGGTHVDAVRKASKAYEHVQPDLVGNEQRVLVSDQSGKGNLLAKLQQFGLDPNAMKSEDVRRVVDDIKRLESMGFSFEDAEASVELLVRRSQPEYVAPFELLDQVVLVEKRKGLDILAEATVKIRVDGAVRHTAAEGTGPVNALDSAIRKALLDFYPQLQPVRLIDYKVRVLDNHDGTSAAVRVSIVSTDGEHTWTTVGSSLNIIEASWLALSDSLEYPLVKWLGVERAESLQGVGVLVK